MHIYIYLLIDGDAGSGTSNVVLNAGAQVGSKSAMRSTSALTQLRGQSPLNNTPRVQSMQL